MSVHSEIRCDGCGKPDPGPAASTIYYTARSTRVRLAEIGWVHVKGRRTKAGDYCPKCAPRRGLK